QIGPLLLLPRFQLAQAVGERRVLADPRTRGVLAGSPPPERPRPFGARRRGEDEDAARGERSVGAGHREEWPALGARNGLRPRRARPRPRDRASRAPTPAPPAAPRCSAGSA